MLKMQICLVALAAGLLVACGKKEEGAPEAAASAPAASAPASSAQSKSGQPDFGGVTKVSREVEAIGSTQELAVVSALQMAIAQVNGVRVASQMQSVRAGLDVSVNGQQAESVRSEAFAQKLMAASQGAVRGFEVLSQQEIDKVDEETIARVRASDGGYTYSASSSSEGEVKLKSSASAKARSEDASAEASRSVEGSAAHSESAKVEAKRGATSYESDVSQRKMRSYWKVRVRVDVAQYRAPDEQGRPKIVVAMPRTMAKAFPVGDSTVPSDEVANAVRGRLSDILTQTKRFIVLDRQFGSEMQSEIDRINSGNVRVEDSARLGQQLATDLILIPTVERFEYPRHVQKLRMSNRELVSYSGGGRITLRLLNATTGEVVMSDSFEHKLNSAEPSTMPRVVDGKSMAAEMMDSLSGQIGGAIVAEIFPVSVVALNGDQVVLSQGGDSLREGQRWQAVLLGEELKDPQTGRSLGRSEAPAGVVRIERVSGKTSYGAFEGGAPNLGGKPFSAGLIELRKKAPTKDANVAGTVQAESKPVSAQKPTSNEPRTASKQGAPVKEKATVKADEDKSW